MYIDIITRIVPEYGYLPIVVVNGVEVFRGSFFTTALEAYEAAYAAALAKGYLK